MTSAAATPAFCISVREAMPLLMAAVSRAAAPAPVTTRTVTKSVPGSRALLVRLSERPTEVDLAVVDADVEPAVRIAADPCLVGNGCTIPAVVAHRQQFAVPAFPTLRQLDVLDHKSSLTVARAAHAALRPCGLRPGVPHSMDTNPRTHRRNRTRPRNPALNRRAGS